LANRRLRRRSSRLAGGESIGGGLIDAGGQRRRRLADATRHSEDLKKREAEIKKENKRKKVSAPVLNTIGKIGKVVSSTPEFPIYKIESDESMRQIGKTIFGGDGYNRLKTETARNVGPHFDAYSTAFSPWTIHRNESESSGIVRAMFLPDDEWREYLSKSDNCAETSESMVWERQSVGDRLFAKGGPLVVSTIGKGSIHLIWHGSVEDSALPGPSVHDFTRNFLPGFVTSFDNRGMAPWSFSDDYQDHEQYSIFALQTAEGNFNGFREV